MRLSLCQGLGSKFRLALNTVQTQPSYKPRLPCNRRSFLAVGSNCCDRLGLVPPQARIWLPDQPDKPVPYNRRRRRRRWRHRPQRDSDQHEAGEEVLQSQMKWNDSVLCIFTAVQKCFDPYLSLVVRSLSGTAGIGGLKMAYRVSHKLRGLVLQLHWHVESMKSRKVE